MRVSDRVCVLRLGQKVFDGPMASLDGTELVALMTGAVMAPRETQAPAH